MTEEETGPDVPIAAGEDRPDWETESDIDGEPSVGDTLRFSKPVSEADIERFALASGDTNPLHLDAASAAGTRFGGRIAHGGLIAGIISAALARLPGTVVYLEQDLTFRSPVRIGETVTAELEVVDDLSEAKYRLRTVARTDGDAAVEGTATVLIEDA